MDKSSDKLSHQETKKNTNNEENIKTKGQEVFEILGLNNNCKTVEIAWKQVKVKKIDYSSPAFKKWLEKINISNEESLKNSKPDWEKAYEGFTI